MRQMMKIGVLMPAAVLLVSGCATKDWVREQFTKSDAIVDQRFVKVEGQVDGVSTEVKGVTTQVKSLEGAVAEAKGRADAAFRAQVLATSPVLKPILDAFPVGQISNGDGVSAQLRVQRSNTTREDSGMMRLDYHFSVASAEPPAGAASCSGSRPTCSTAACCRARRPAPPSCWC